MSPYMVAWLSAGLERPVRYTTCLRHLCDNRQCINLEHLQLGTYKQNSEDMVTRGRQEKGAARYCAKLTQEDVRTMRALHRTGLHRPTALLAQAFDVTRGTVSSILRGLRWKHV